MITVSTVGVIPAYANEEQVKVEFQSVVEEAAEVTEVVEVAEEAAEVSEDAEVEAVAFSGFYDGGTYLMYFDPVTGEKATGWKTIDGHTYYFLPATGAALKGTQVIDGKYYTFDTTTYRRITGFVGSGSTLMYYSTSTGERLYGFQTISGSTYYFYPSSGVALTGIQLINNKYYLFDETTAKQVVGPGTANGSDQTYFYLADGGRDEGLITWNGNTYYGEPNKSGELIFGLTSVDGNLYYFDKSTGAAIKSQTVVFSNIQMTANSSGVITSWKAASGFEDNVRVKMLLSGMDKLGDAYGEDVSVPNTWACGYYVRTLFGEQDASISEAMGLNASYEQAKKISEGTLGKQVTESELKPGDAIYWSLSPCAHGDNCTQFGGVHHTGIYLGNGKVLEASEARGEVVIQDIREYSNEVSTYKIEYRANMYNDSKYDAMNAAMVDGVEYFTVDTSNMKVSSLTATSNGTNRVSLSWNTVSGADGYLIYGIKNGVYGYVGMTTQGTTYTDTKAITDWNYYWVFPYVKDATGKMHTGSCTTYKYAQGICPAVTYLRSSSLSGGNKLTWVAAANAQGYLVYGRRGATGAYGYIGMTTQGTTYLDMAAPAGYSYYWVYAYGYDTNGKMTVGKTPTYTYGQPLK